MSFLFGQNAVPFSISFCYRAFSAQLLPGFGTLTIQNLHERDTKSGLVSVRVISWIVFTVLAAMWSLYPGGNPRL
jgi:hypothetical protein